MSLQKAKLENLDNPNQSLEFMFNPAQISFEGNVNTSESPGARSTKTGKPKVSYANKNSSKITLNDILFDTYETKKDVVESYIKKFQDAIDFHQQDERPPTFKFIWGNRIYLDFCFIEKLSYKLTFFLSDGTPVRAVIDSLSLIETDNPKESESVEAKQPNTEQRRKDTIKSRQKKRR
ncbi:hypothetical protein NIES267_10110 [Calothrix parasitica NIES-267]|uniref:Contractile injection system tube protein N-terminal domain-containing protein n=1 Tax=Calothrix parasitica NIES-267 TaxID=1973488 RepID=A0A1Z4LK13_9CYAN|nr:hypothetical protein NIES267_10110 [Calothrix parasitica NIES-267]